MRKIYFLTMLFLFAFLTNAQVTIQGVPRSDAQAGHFKKQAKNVDFTMDNINYWVGSGAKKAALVIQWNDEKNPDAMVWGFRWDGRATGEDMIKAIAKADKRFYTLMFQGTQYGSAIGGIGFDLDQKGSIGLYKDNNTTYPLYPLDGIVKTTAYDFDAYKAIDANDHWQSGWYQGYWSYWITDDTISNFDYSPLGASSRELEDGSWDLWNFYVGMEPQDTATSFVATTPYTAQADFTKGFFMVNEEWFGHTNGSVNFIGDNGQVYYRVYSDKNNNEAFGATTQYGTIYGDKFYFISKQAQDGGDIQYTPGGRLVIANALTMEKIKTFNDIGGGDGRSFLGVDEHTGYIGASNGIFLFNIDNLEVGAMIDGTGGGSLYSGQIGNMLRTSQFVYAVKQGVGILIIDPKTNSVIKTIAGAYSSVVQAKDGSVWAALATKIVKIDEKNNFATNEYSVPTLKIGNSWNAWNAGSFTASAKDNAIYWVHNYGNFAGGPNIVKFDVTNKTFNDNFAKIPGQEGQYKQIAYGSALRVNPVTGDLILNTSESGYSSHYQKNWVHTFNNNGELTKTISLNDYYWFPAITVFPNGEGPKVVGTLPTEVTVNELTKIDLKNIVTDSHNQQSAIIKSIVSNTANKSSSVHAEINLDDELVLTPLSNGISTVIVRFNSNGQYVDKSITAKVATLGTSDGIASLGLQVYPNPTSDFAHIKTNDKVQTISLIDMAGNVLSTMHHTSTVDLRSLSKGVYILTIKTDKGEYQQKIIKN